MKQLKYRNFVAITDLPLGRNAVLSTAFACGLAFVLLGMAAAATHTLPGDERITDTVQRLPGLPWHFVADIGNVLGMTGLWLLAMPLLALFAVRRSQLTLGVALATLLLLRMLAGLLKPQFASPRPSNSDVIIRSNYEGYGFPSGHMLSATILALAITLLVRTLWHDRKFAAPVIVVMWLWAAACGFARIWDGAHWSTDVIGGLLLGVAITGLSITLAPIFVALLLRPAYKSQRKSGTQRNQ